MSISDFLKTPPIPDMWNILTSVGTIAMAITTYWVIRQNEKHHHNAFKPICLLVPEHGVDPTFPRSEILKCREVAPSDPSHGTYEIYSTLKNIGCGPAMNIILEIRARKIADYGVTWRISPLAKEDGLGNKEHPILIPVTFSDRFNSVDFQSVTNETWEIFIEYQDCFGNIFHTRHTKDPREPWSSFGNGPMPKET